MVMTSSRKNNLAEAAVLWLRERMPGTWSVELSSQLEMAMGAGRADATIEVRSPNLSATLAVEERRSLGPRDVDRLLGSLGRTRRPRSPNIPILVVAPWLSARTRDLLAAEGLNYIDLT